MKSNPKLWLYGPNWQGKRCEARTRRGTLCQRPGSKRNGRCKFHGGRSQGPVTKEGLARLSRTKTIHGRFSKENRKKAQEYAELGRALRAELNELEIWFVENGYLEKTWRNYFR